MTKERRVALTMTGIGLCLIGAFGPSAVGRPTDPDLIAGFFRALVFFGAFLLGRAAA